MRALLHKLLLSVSLIVAGFALCAQEEPIDSVGFEGFETPKNAYVQNVVKASLIPFLVGQIPYCGEFRITYERMLTHNQSLVLGASYNYPNLFLLIASAGGGRNSFSRFSFRGGRILVGYRYYPIKKLKAPNGLFVGPHFSYNFVKIKEKNGDGSYQILNYLNATATVGYQVAFTKNFYGEVIAGLGYRKNFTVSYNAPTNTRATTDNKFFIPALTNVKLLMMINVGYAF